MASDTTIVRGIIEVSESSRRSHYRGPVVDCDVHHTWPTQEALLPYLEEGWQEYVRMPRGQHRPLFGPNDFVNPHGGGGVRQETYPEVGGNPGSDYETMRKQLLDPFDVRRAVLTYNEGLFGLNRLRNPYMATAIARAANDWTIDQWLQRDKRLVGSILVANHLPEEAAAEIRRVGRHPQMGQVIITGNGIGQPLGHPVFYPIYEAATELDLPVAIHSGGGGFGYQPAAGGLISFYLEYHIMMFQPIQTQILSLISHAVFEKFPKLRILVLEGGVAWVPAFLWRMDADYKGLRREVPWMNRLPSEYFHDHFRLTTQPFELAPNREHMIQILDMFDGKDMLLFATDYPHWDTDDVDYIATRLPKDWMPNIYYQNAIDFYRWTASDLGITSSDDELKVH
jgi:uncharacterized protein